MSDLVGYEFPVENGLATVTGDSVMSGYVNIDVRRPDGKVVQSARARSLLPLSVVLGDAIDGYDAELPEGPVALMGDSHHPAPTDNIFVRIQNERALREQEGSATSPPAREDPSIEA